MMAWLRALGRRRAERLALVERDSRDLIAHHGATAYQVARERVRAERDGTVVDGNRPHGHWTRVKLRIAALTGREVGLDGATRRACDR